MYIHFGIQTNTHKCIFCKHTYWATAVLFTFFSLFGVQKLLLPSFSYFSLFARLSNGGGGGEEGRKIVKRVLFKKEK